MSDPDIDLSFALRFPDTCSEGVNRGDEYEPCEKSAVAFRIDVEHGTYPVCARHSRAPMVQMSDVLAEVREQIAAQIEAKSAGIKPGKGLASQAVAAGIRVALAHAAHIARGETS